MLSFRKILTASLLVLLKSGVLAQTSTYFSPGVPTDAPIPGNYTGAYRPRVHFSPPQDFMNDPNGMFVDANGTWHLYYQYNPTATVAGNQHWGHATSTDLYHWENQKIALWTPNNETFVFSGSAVVDVNNTSGFFPGQGNGVVAIYTLAQYPGGAAGPQTQNIAISHDGGYTFDAYASNPVIDSTSSQFRDPKVIWYEPGQHWVMVLAFAVDFSIGIYTSDNLVDWTPRSNVTNVGLLGLQYECPNLVQMPWQDGPQETAWVLAVSINPGAPLGGSITQYFAGDFNGTHFLPFDHAARIADFSKDNYAGQFFDGIPGTQNQVSIAWASNWQYTQQVPTGSTEGWRSQMSLPRVNYIRNATRIGYVLVSEPYNIQSIFSQELAYNSSLGNSSILLDYSNVPSGALYFEANITSLSPSTAIGTLNFTFSSSVSGEYITGGTTVNGDTWLDRGKTTAFDNPYFTDKFSASGLYSGADNGTWTISGVIDRSIFEIFVNDAEQSGTMTFYSTQALDTMRIGANGIASNATVSVGVWALEDAWAAQAHANGTVIGNVTTGATNGTYKF